MSAIPVLINTEITQMESKPKTVWYFAYGSNMSKAKFTGSRGIVPEDIVLVRISGWSIAMEIPGIPYLEPSFSSITPRNCAASETATTPDVVGVAYLITEEQYAKIIASEGGGIAYCDTCILGERIAKGMQGQVGGRLMVRTLTTALLRWPPPAPSQRYMDLLTEGGRESQLPQYYQKYLSCISVFKPARSAWTQLGASVFVGFWGPVVMSLEKLTKKSVQKDGNSPRWVIVSVRWTFKLMWACHDYIFGPVFGRGDGLII